MRISDWSADVCSSDLAKAEIFAGLQVDGVAVLNRDNPHFERLAASARAAGAAEVIGFCEHPEAQARLVKFASHSSCSCVAAEILGHPLTFKIGAPGRPWVLNALGVLATAHIAGADLAEAGLALADITAPQGRGDQTRLPWRAGASAALPAGPPPPNPPTPP